jgi:single-strand DNA-binding protein
MYLNKVQIIGNLTRDPELKSLPSGIKVASFSLATNRTWKDADGQRKDASEFHNIVAFAKPAELISQYCKKGSSLYVEGRLQTRSWDDAATGQKKYRTEIVVENFQFGPKSTGTGAGQSSSGAQDTYPKMAKPAKKDAESVDTIEYPDEDINPEDIPF